MKVRGHIIVAADLRKLETGRKQVRRAGYRRLSGLHLDRVSIVRRNIAVLTIPLENAFVHSRPDIAFALSSLVSSINFLRDPFDPGLELLLINPNFHSI